MHNQYSIISDDQQSFIEYILSLHSQLYILFLLEDIILKIHVTSNFLLYS